MGNNKDIDFLIDQISAMVESKKIELPSEYAEQTRKIPPELTPFKNEPFSFVRFLYFRRIMDSLSPTDPIKEVVL